MAYVKKISAKQFSLDVVDFMLKKYNITHEDIEKLPHRPENKDEWDDTIAAEKYRLVQAGEILRFIVYEEDERPEDRPEIKVFHITERSEG